MIARSSSAFSARVHGISKTLGRGAIVVLLCFLSVETAARLARLWLRPEPPAEVHGKTVVLAVGDSFTFGMGVVYDLGARNQTPDGRRPLSYPELLQDLLERSSPGRYRVVTWALAGRNSSQVAKELPLLLERLRPVAVLVLVGTNNTTNYEDSRYLEVAARKSASPPEDRLIAWSQYFLSARLVYNVVRAFQHRLYPTPAGSPGLPDARSLSEAEGAIHEQLLERDLGEIVDTARARGAAPFIATYPEPLPSNPKIHLIAEARHVPLLDLEKRFSPILAEQGRQHLISYMDAFHCNARGYSEMALAFYDALARAGAPWSPPLASPDQSSWLSERRQTTAWAEARRSGIDPSCALDLTCTLAWFDARENVLDAAGLLQELAPPSLWVDLATKRIDRLITVEGRSPARSYTLYSALLHDHRSMAYDIAREEARRHPDESMWPTLVEAARPPTDAIELPLDLPVTDPAIHREGHPTPSNGGLEYPTGGLALWIQVRSRDQASYRVSAVVSGTPCPENEWPIVSCSVDGQVAFEARATKTPTPATSPAITLSAGVHRLELSFPNDHYEPNHCDRNLTIHSLRIEPSR